MHADGTVELWPAYLRSASEGVRPRGGQAGAFAIVLFDQAGTELMRHAFDPDPVAVHAPIVHATFGATLPWHPSTQRIAVTRGNVVLAERLVSPSAPSVRLLSPNGGEHWPGQGDIQLTWEASDADGDVLHFAVDYSPERGQDSGKPSRPTSARPAIPCAPGRSPAASRRWCACAPRMASAPPSICRTRRS